VATAIAALGLVGAAAQHFTGLWHDLGSTTLLRPVGTILPTQFGRDDELLASMPLGMETVYQKVLLPGEADQLFTGQVETLRGLVYPYQAVRELRTPSELYDALGLGFVVSGVAGSDTLAFNRDAESVDVLRCAGLRQDDLVTPIDSDVNLPDGTLPPPLVRHHRRPWTGTARRRARPRRTSSRSTRSSATRASESRTSQRSGGSTPTGPRSTSRRTTRATASGSATPRRGRPWSGAGSTTARTRG